MILKFVMWFLSVLFIMAGVIGFIAQDPLPALYLFLFGLIVNPKISDKLKSIHSIFSKKWFKPIAFILCMFLFGFSISSAPVNDDSVNKDNPSDSETIVTQVSTDSLEKNSSDNSIPNVKENAKLIVNYLDVGQADSIFIELPNGQTMLIDAGNNEDDKTIVNYIKNLSYDTIDYLIGTHPHEDHIGGLDTIINTFNIGSIYMPKVQSTTKTFEDVLLAIQEKGLKINTAKAGVDIIDTDDFAIKFLAPVNDTYEDLNNYSAVIKITYKNNSFLFMGDAEELSEFEILAQSTQQKLNSDVLKVGHHGSSSSTSDAFLEAANPKYAIISVGKDNSYGHPSNSVLDLLNESGITVYRTDESGTIVATSDGNNISIDKDPSSYDTNAPPISENINQEDTNIVVPTEIEEPIAEDIPVSEETKEVIVYVTKTGEKYHSDGCQYLKKSKIPMSLEDAKKYYTPCSKCNPPR